MFVCLIDNILYVKALKIITICVWILLIFLHLIFSTGYLAHLSMTQLASKYPTYLTPSSWALYIWVIVLLLQGAYAIYQTLPNNPKNELLPVLRRRLGIFLPAAMFLESMWIIVFAFEVIWLSLTIMIGILTLLSISWFRIYYIPAQDRNMDDTKEPSKLQTNTNQQKIYVFIDYAIVVVPTSMNFAWITMASLVNLLVLFTSLGHELDPSYAGAMISVASVVAMFILFMKRDMIYPIVVLWAIAAIITNQTNVIPVMFTAYICLVLVGIGTLGMLLLPLWKRWIARNDLSSRNPVSDEKKALLQKSAIPVHSI